jgi:ribosomal protein S18 acetylase RimI-like enzyme
VTNRIVPFTDTLIPQAASLLAFRHRSDRTVLPFLPCRFENTDEAGRCIRVLIEEKKSNGFAVLKDGRLRAFLLGDEVYGPLWGRTGWVRVGGWALDAGADTELVRELYAALGEQWVGRGIFTHFAVVPAADPEILRTWVTLSFGIEQVYAVADLSAVAPSERGRSRDNAVEIRRAGRGDRETLANLSDIIWRHQTGAPVWGVKPPETVEDVRKSWAGLPDDETADVWLAVKGDKGNEAVGVQVYQPAVRSDENLLVPDNAVELVVGATRESFRGEGIGTALTRFRLHRAASAGYRHCTTDWRSTNLQASRFWPRFGFRPAGYRLVRRIDGRIAWSAGR